MTRFDDLFDAIEEAEFLAKEQGCRQAVIAFGGGFGVMPVKKLTRQIPLEIIRPKVLGAHWFKNPGNTKPPIYSLQITRTA